MRRGGGAGERAGLAPNSPAGRAAGAGGSFPRASVQFEQNGTGMHFRFIKKYTLKKALGEKYKPQILVNVFLHLETSRQNAPPPNRTGRGSGPRRGWRWMRRQREAREGPLPRGTVLGLRERGPRLRPSRPLCPPSASGRREGGGFLEVVQVSEVTDSAVSQFQVLLGPEGVWKTRSGEHETSAALGVLKAGHPDGCPSLQKLDDGPLVRVTGHLQAAVPRAGPSTELQPPLPPCPPSAPRPPAPAPLPPAHAKAFGPQGCAGPGPDGATGGAGREGCGEARGGNERTVAHGRCWAAGDRPALTPSQLATSPGFRALSFPGDGALLGRCQPGLQGPCTPLSWGLPSPSWGLTQEPSLPRLLSKHESPRGRQTLRRPGLRREPLGRPLRVGACWHRGCPRPRGARRGGWGRALVAAAWVLRPRDLGWGLGAGAQGGFAKDRAEGPAPMDTPLP